MPLLAYGDVQMIWPLSYMLPIEQDLPDEVAILMAEGKHERMHALRQLQATSNIIHKASGQTKTLSDFAVPPGVFAGPVGPNQKRVVREVDGRAKAFILTGVDTPAVSHQQVLDDAVEHVPLLVLGLDHGSAGGAGAGFCQ